MLTNLEKAKKHIHEALDGILSGGCKAQIVTHLEKALEKISEEQELSESQDSEASD